MKKFRDVVENYTHILLSRYHISLAFYTNFENNYLFNISIFKKKDETKTFENLYSVTLEEVITFLHTSVFPENIPKLKINYSQQLF